jgi:DNA helicase-2/ATP-dependent DNA helicase PcrA
MSGFTPEQQAFLRHDPGRPGRLVAGPGAGKSYTCVAYVERYANPEGDFPARIRMLTFTRAAAAEFAETMERQGLGEGIPEPSTIHAFALSILGRSGWTGIPQPLRIAGKWEADRLIRTQLSRLLRALGHDRATPSVVKRLEIEMAAGFDSLDPNNVMLGAADPALRNAYRGTWLEHRVRLGYVLLAELPFRAGLAVEDLGLPALDIDLLLVDEYQDLNKADIHLVQLVAQGGINVVAIGDEDQSIYGWRHAAPQGIRDFPTDFGVTPENDYRLTVSRRCGTTILRAAQDLIEQAPDRPRQPPMTPLNPEKPGFIAYLRFRGMVEEAAGVATIVQARLRARIPAKKIAVLSRTRVEEWVAAMTPAFDGRGIAIASDAWVDAALNDEALIRLRALAQLSLNEDDSLAWMTLIELEHGMGGTLMDRVYRAIARDETFAQAIKRVARDGLGALRPHENARLRALVNQTLAALSVLELGEDEQVEDWGRWLTERAGATLSRDAVRLLEVVGNKLTGVTLGAFLGELEPTGSDFALAEVDAVRFMTMQGSKGLTFDTVIVVGVEEGYVPYPRSDPSEERRLLYVAMTRATDFCVLSFSGQRIGPLARSGRENLGRRTRSALLEGVLDVQSAADWIQDQGWT